MVDFVKKTEVRRFPPTHGKRFRATVSRNMVGETEVWYKQIHGYLVQMASVKNTELIFGNFLMNFGITLPKFGMDYRN
jgi:hypothetical protein